MSAQSTIDNENAKAIQALNQAVLANTTSIASVSTAFSTLSGITLDLNADTETKFNKIGQCLAALGVTVLAATPTPS